MANVAFDAFLSGGNAQSGKAHQVANATSVSISSALTVGASSTLLVIPICWQNIFAGGTTAPSSVSFTWNGAAMTAGPTVNVNDGTDVVTVQFFYLINPATGLFTLAGSWSGHYDCYLGAVSFTGTDTTTGIVVADNTTATNVTSITEASTTDGATVAVFCANGSVPTTNFNQIFAIDPDRPCGGASYQLGGTSNAHTFTGSGGSVKALAAIHVIAAGGTNNTQTPTGFALSTSLGTPTVNISGVQVAPVGFGLNASIGSPTINVSGSGTVTPTGILVTASVGTPTVLNTVKLIPTGFLLNVSLGTFTIESDINIVGNFGLLATTSIGTPAVNINNSSGATINPIGFGLNASIGVPSVAFDKNITVTGLSVTASLGTPSFSILTLNPTGFGLTASLGSPTVLNSGLVSKPTGFLLNASLGIPQAFSGAGSSRSIVRGFVGVGVGV